MLCFLFCLSSSCVPIVLLVFVFCTHCSQVLIVSCLVFILFISIVAICLCEGNTGFSVVTLTIYIAYILLNLRFPLFDIVLYQTSDNISYIKGDRYTMDILIFSWIFCIIFDLCNVVQL